MHIIQTLDTIDPQGLVQFPADKYLLDAKAATPSAIMVRSSDLHTRDFPATLKAVGRAGVGVNNIPLAKLTELGIPVFYTPGANANAVKELVLAGMLLATRNLYPALEFVRQLKAPADQFDAAMEQQKKQFRGSELAGKTLGVIGLGQIGVKVANAALALGMKVIGFDPSMTLHNALALSSEIRKVENLSELLTASQFISLHVPLLENTRHFLKAEELALLKPETILLNFSRGEIVDLDAVIGALNNKKLRCYVTDFPTPELQKHPAAICLPHLGASTAEAEQNSAYILVNHLRDFLEYGYIKHSANFPDVHLPPGAAFRLVVINKNIPGMVAQISELLSRTGHNIITMLNKSRENVAYNLIDMDTSVDEKSLLDLSALPGIIRAYNLAPLS